MIAPTGCGALEATAAQNCWVGVKPASCMGIAATIPSGTFCSAIASRMKRPRPSRSDANAVPIANPSGRLCTSSTPKTSTERRTGAAQFADVDVVAGDQAPRRDQERDTRDAAGHHRRGRPSSSAGSSSPTIDATVIKPAASPHRKGRSARARARGRASGTAPRPVAKAVAVPPRPGRRGRRASSRQPTPVGRPLDRAGHAARAAAATASSEPAIVMTSIPSLRSRRVGVDVALVGDDDARRDGETLLPSSHCSRSAS